MQRMIAARLYGKQDLRVEEVPKPDIEQGEILLRVKAAHVCGTDIRMFRGGVKASAIPLIPGHEFSGTVEEAGGKSSGYEIGTGVAVAPNMGCGICDTCVSGNTQLCPQSQALGVTLNGGFAEFVKIPEDAVRQGNVVQIPENVSFQDAALAEPLSCVYNAFELCNLKPGETVLIFGAGPIGLMHARLHLLAGASKVVINDINPQRLSQCRSLLPDAITVGSEDLKGQIDSLTHGRGADICITACPSPEAQRLSLELVSLNGRIIFFGGLPADRAEVLLNTNLIHYRQIRVTGTTRQSLSQFRKTLHLISERLIDLSGLITSVVPLSQIHSAFNSTLAGEGLKSSVTPGGSHG